MSTVKLAIPPKLIPLFTAPDKRYRCAYGGRGSGKTRTFALMTAVRGYQLAESGDRGVILCAREFMNSLDESSMEEVKQAIRSVEWLERYYDIGEKYIRTNNGRVKYVFSGLRHNLDSIKSKAKIQLCWIDEAEGVSEVAYQKLLPTIREEGSELWVTWNPESNGSPTDNRFRKDIGVEGECIEMQYWDNPWFPSVLELERLSDLRRLDPQTYAWIWEGAYLESSDKQVFNGKYRIEEFEAPKKGWDGPYYGVDWGFSQDPTAGVRAWVNGDKLMIDYEYAKVGLELDETAQALIKAIPGIEKHTVRADNARPESISYVKRNGLSRIEGVKKGKGSVEDGIQFIRSFREVIIHPRCTKTLEEFRLYSYKVDRLSGDVLSDIVDANNHLIDALRYALEPLMRRNTYSWSGFA